MAKLQGKIALITGSGRGIGREVALKLASEGASIVVNDLDSAPADETVAAITAAGGKAVACIGSVTAVDFAERFVKTALDHFGGIARSEERRVGKEWGSTVRSRWSP